FMAILASVWAFAWQIALSKHARSGDMRLGSGLIALALVFAMVYAGKDRMKEIGRNWIAGRVRRLYAQRVTHYRAPPKRFRTRDVVAVARESIDLETRQAPDALNPATGATLPVAVIRYVHKGRTSSRPELSAAGLGRVKHVFRYDLSPLFAWLDD